MEAIASDQQQTDDPFQSLKLASHDVLERALQNGRSTCHRCNGSRMFYCYTCHALLKSLPHEEIPEIKLPLNIDIIKHPNETDGKSTAVHAKLLAPNDVNIYIYPCIPEYEDHKHEIVLLFPGVDSISVEDIPAHVQKMCKMTAVPGKETTDSKEEPFPKRLKLDLQECSSSLIENKLAKHCVTAEQKTKPLLKKAVFIDSTWNQTGKIITDERLRGRFKKNVYTQLNVGRRRFAGQLWVLLAKEAKFKCLAIGKQIKVREGKIDELYDGKVIAYTQEEKEIKKTFDSFVYKINKKEDVQEEVSRFMKIAYEI
ncbi:tRNA-uridine aminocarboxypropyltransferase 1 [Protopterus annectens]|uniref:tRNA-uridine aminocarboxypropyltransferase 1 n=1 Tax=Protopterus annectens TaxID=7888 RepID=UPI001CFBC9B1|nr:tRNA-uridine aminocarboxypropyltransferase 1 [Protopterus annectens]